MMNDIEGKPPLFEVPRNEVILGSYDPESWVISDFTRKRYVSGKSTLSLDATWLLPANFSLSNWVASTIDVENYTFFNASLAIVRYKEGLAKICVYRGKLEAAFIGDATWCNDQVKLYDTHLTRARSLIQWVYSPRGDEITVPLNYRPMIKAAYPWMKKDINDYVDDYLNSQASLLILIGKPGTGKTTFIRNMIHRSKANAKVAYDELVISDDGFFAGFIDDDDSRFLVMEDADNFLAARSDGNTMMHKFLNVSDGLVSAADKKIVFSTNLPNVRDIDPALVRPGRCFDIIEFRPLTIAEAEAVIEETGSGSIPEGAQTVTLAELFSVQSSSDTVTKTTMGFV